MKKILLLSTLLLGTYSLNAQNKSATDLPYSYGFETEDLDGWTIINAGNGNNWAVHQASSETPDPSEGKYYMMYYFHDNPANSYLFSKGLNLKANENINLQFDYMGIDAWFPEKMEVLIGLNPDVESMTQRLWIDEEIINYPYETASVNFEVPTDGVYYIAFRAFSDPDQFYLSLDNIIIKKESLATQEVNKTKLTYYPNPVKDVLTIKNDHNIKNIEIFDLSGKTLIKKVYDSANIDVDISELPKGTYMVKISSENSKKTIKVIKD